MAEKKFDCCFEEPHKGIFLEVVTNPEFNNVDFSAYSDHKFLASICLREKDVDELIDLLQKFKDFRKRNNLSEGCLFYINY